MSILESNGNSDPLGLWGSTPQAVSFDLGNENSPGNAAPFYRVNLPDSNQVAINALAETLDSLAQMNTALTEIPAQLDELIRQQQSRAEGLSFAVTDSTPGTTPESELLFLLAAADTTAFGGSVPEGVSFEIIDAANEVLEQAKEKFTALLEQVNHELLYFAWVETKIAAQTIARTEMSWTGAATSFWIDETSADQVSLHRRTLEIVSQTRNLKLRLLLTISSGAVKMAALMASPTGAVLALPAVYQYVMKIFEQIKQIQSISSS